MLNLAHLNNKFVFILEPIATSLKFATEFIVNKIKYSFIESINVYSAALTFSLINSFKQLSLSLEIGAKSL